MPEVVSIHAWVMDEYETNCAKVESFSHRAWHNNFSTASRVDWSEVLSNYNSAASLNASEKKIVIPVYLGVQNTFYEMQFIVEWKCCHQCHHQVHAVAQYILYRFICRLTSRKTGAKNLYTHISWVARNLCIDLFAFDRNGYVVSHSSIFIRYFFSLSHTHTLSDSFAPFYFTQFQSVCIYSSVWFAGLLSLKGKSKLNRLEDC